jgi:membrane-associated phospholipid phosphatase
VLILLPVVVVRPEKLFKRTLQAYVMMMVIAYAGFLLYPTIAPRPANVNAEGFFAWCLRLTYSLDTRYNCFPSLHVANSFVSALACYRVHKKVGIAAMLWSALIAVSTLFTKQHYVVDVIGGTMMALLAYVVFLRSFPREAIEDSYRRQAPRRALAAVAMYGGMLSVFWILYQTGMVVM